jgi:hypothetical protein
VQPSAGLNVVRRIERGSHLLRLVALKLHADHAYTAAHIGRPEYSYSIDVGQALQQLLAEGDVVLPQIVQPALLKVRRGGPQSNDAGHVVVARLVFVR